MTGLHRLAWVSFLGRRGHGDWMEGSRRHCELVAEFMSEHSICRRYWVESAYGEGARETGTARRFNQGAT